MKERRGNALLALCILSFIWLAYTFFGVAKSYVSGPLTEEELIDEQVVMLESINENNLQEADQVIADSVETLTIQNENFWLISNVTLVSVIIGFVAVFLMFRLRRIGYYFYLLYCLIPLLLNSYLFGGLGIGMFIILVFTVIDFAFIILYSFQLKRMD